METPIRPSQSEDSPVRPSQSSALIPSDFLSRHVNTVKLAGIVILILALLIPLGMVNSLVKGRMRRNMEAIQSIIGPWGSEQTVVGPVLVVPYEQRTKAWKEEIINGKLERTEYEQVSEANAYFLPDELSIDGEITPEKLHRGIYSAVVYRGNLEISGIYSNLDFEALGVAKENVHWNDALVTLAVSDLRGTGETLSIEMGGESHEFTPGCRLKGYRSGVTARLPNVVSATGEISFRMNLDLKGSKGIDFAPLGRENQVAMSSSWTAPSFHGAFLPEERDFSAEGFKATWKTSWYGRSYAQQWTDSGSSAQYEVGAAIEPSLFGVDFLALVDSYSMTERATKYGVLFLVLIFAVFFLFEIMSELRIHPIQYALVGVALCLFYLALLSLSEIVSFGSAYWIGVVASSLLIVLYCSKILKGGKRTSTIAAALLVVYGYLYGILQLQDYALLFGTVALFGALAAVMYVTRNLDWSEKV